MRNKILLPLWLLLLVTIFNIPVALSAEDVSVRPEWVKAVQLKNQLDRNPEVVSGTEKSQFNQRYEELNNEFNRFMTRATQHAEEITSHNKDVESQKKEVSQFNSSCSNPTTEPEQRRCENWAQQLNKWNSRLQENANRLNVLRDTYNSEVIQWATNKVTRFNQDLEKALSQTNQTWTFKSGGQEAQVQVRPDGSIIKGLAWKTYVEGCSPSYYYLTIEGKFMGSNVRFTLKGEGCEGRSKIEAQGSGVATPPFPGTKHASGSFKGYIEDPPHNKASRRCNIAFTFA